MSYGPADFGSVLQGVGSIGGAIAVCVAAWFASNSFDGWRKQKISERRIEQAERILTATYNVRRGLNRVRSSVIYGHERIAAEEKLKADGNWPASKEAQRRISNQQLFYTRLSNESESIQKVEECLPMARALFGEELEKALEVLTDQFYTVKICADWYAEDPRHNTHEDNHKIRSGMYHGFGAHSSGNEVDEIIAAQVKLVEDICVPVLRLEGIGKRY